MKTNESLKLPGYAYFILLTLVVQTAFCSLGYKTVFTVFTCSDIKKFSGLVGLGYALTLSRRFKGGFDLPGSMTITLISGVSRPSQELRIRF